MTDTLHQRIARIKADFGNRPPESLVRVLAIYESLADAHPLAELERVIDQAAKHARQMLAGVPGPTFPRRALELQEPPARSMEDAA